MQSEDAPKWLLGSQRCREQTGDFREHEDTRHLNHSKVWICRCKEPGGQSMSHHGYEVQMWGGDGRTDQLYLSLDGGAKGLETLLGRLNFHPVGWGSLKDFALESNTVQFSSKNDKCGMNS